MSDKVQSCSADSAEAIVFWYKNYKGEQGYRRAIPISMRYGTSDYHHSPQWLMLAFDTEKQAEREFAMSDMSHNCLGGEIKLGLVGVAQASPDGRATLIVALEKIAGVREYTDDDHANAALYKRDDGVWTTDEYLADQALSTFRAIAAPSPAPSSWQQIETAPATEWGKTNRLPLWSKKLGGMCVGEVGNHNGHVWASVSSFHGNAVEDWGVTHWMPPLEGPVVASTQETTLQDAAQRLVDELLSQHIARDKFFIGIGTAELHAYTQLPRVDCRADIIGGWPVVWHFNVGPIEAYSVSATDGASHD